MVRLRERLNLLDQLNLDLQFGVAVNLAHMYAANQLYREALNAYTQIVKGKTHAQVGRVLHTCLCAGGTLRQKVAIAEGPCPHQQAACSAAFIRLDCSECHVLKRICG